jgi:uncharacterized membrane protein YoaK (UPF0700 family)
MANVTVGRADMPIFPQGRDSMVLVLTWAASAVDAISYLGLGHVFTANMTGNAVLLGVAIGQGQGLAAVRSMIALAGFSVGVALGAVIVQKRTLQTDWPRAVTKAVLLEAAILVAFTGAWHLGARGGVPLYGLIALSALAMGVQSAAIRHLKVPGVATTYITGTITSLVAEFTSWLCSLRSSPGPESSEHSAPVEVSQNYRGARLQALVVLIYIAAALLSAFLQARHSRLVTLSPLIAVVLVATNALAHHRSR